MKKSKSCRSGSNRRWMSSGIIRSLKGETGCFHGRYIVIGKSLRNWGRRFDWAKASSMFYSVVKIGAQSIVNVLPYNYIIWNAQSLLEWRRRMEFTEYLRNKHQQKGRTQTAGNISRSV
jgi:hypothetical protein